jgi:hypothetical protein
MRADELCGRVMEIMKEHKDFDTWDRHACRRAARELIFTAATGSGPRRNTYPQCQDSSPGSRPKAFRPDLLKGSPSVGYDPSRR